MRGAPHVVAAALGAAAALLVAAFGDGVAGAAAGIDAVALVALGATVVAAGLIAAAALRRGPGRGVATTGRTGGAALLGAAAAFLAGAALSAAGLALPDPAGTPQVRERPGGGLRLVLAGGLREEPLDAPARDGLPFRALRRRRRGVAVLLVGFPAGRVLADALALPNRTITILESDEALVASAARRWPSLAAALSDGTVRVIGGNPRRALARLEGRFDLVAFVEGWSAEARSAGALNRRREPRLTLEAFRGYLAHLAPRGFLLFERAGAARALLTLREASAADARFPGRVAVLQGRGGRTRFWYRPAGLSQGRFLDALRRHARAGGALELYRPLCRDRWNFYYPLVTGSRPRGLAFSTLADLSPARDDRPYFDHGGRVRLTPTGALLPDEPWTPGEERQAAPVPRGDGKQLLVLAAALGALALGAAPGLRRAGREGAEAAAAGDLRRAVGAGAAMALALPALAAWAELAAPGPAVATAAVGAGLAGVGGGWLAAGRWPKRVALFGPGVGAGAAAVACGGAYPLVPHLFLAGTVPAAVLVVFLCAGAGLAVGGGAGAALCGCAARLGDDRRWVTAWAAGAAAAAWTAAPLLAASLGFRALWALAAIALLSAARGSRTPDAA